MVYEWNTSKYKSSSKVQANIGEELLYAIKISKKDTVLDAGCGLGNLTTEIASKVSEGYVIGIDSSSAMINSCKKLKNDFNNMEFINKSLLDIEYDEKFDIIFSNSVLHWIKDNDKLLEVFYKSLKNGGKIGLQFPIFNSNHPLIYFTNKVINELELNNYYKDWDNPWYEADEKKINEKLNDLNFQDINIYIKHSCTDFDSTEEVYNFFDSVGLKLFLDNIPEEKRMLFINRLNEDLKKEAEDEKIKLNFERIFIFANKRY